MKHWGRYGHLFPDDIFKCILLSKNVFIVIKISLKLVSWASINNIPALFQMMDLKQWWWMYWRVYASPGLNELKPRGTFY